MSKSCKLPTVMEIAETLGQYAIWLAKAEHDIDALTRERDEARRWFCYQFEDARAEPLSTGGDYVGTLERSEMESAKAWKECRRAGEERDEARRQVCQMGAKYSKTSWVYQAKKRGWLYLWPEETQ